MDHGTRQHAERLLPLKSAWLHILIAIAEGAKHGYAIRRRVEDRTDGQIKLWPTSLYGTLDRLSASGLLAEEPSDETKASSRGRRDYELTELGSAVLALEIDRLEELVVAARATPTLQDGTS